MIKWTEQRADIGPRPVAERRRALPVLPPTQNGLDASLNPGTPAVVWSAGCRDFVFSHLAGQNYEQGGLLLGHVWHADDDPAMLLCIDVIDAAAAPESRGTAISLSMGTDLWDQARQQASADQHIVGWYHSHPGLGAFFSVVDRNTQAAFFREAWHLGLVVDPANAQTAWFRGIDSLEVDDSLILISDDS